MLLVKKCNFFHNLFLLKIRVKIRFNNILKRTETFFDYENKVFQTPKNHIFPKGLTHAFGKKWNFFHYFPQIKELKSGLTMS